MKGKSFKPGVDAADPPSCPSATEHTRKTDSQQKHTKSKFTRERPEGSLLLGFAVLSTQNRFYAYKFAQAVTQIKLGDVSAISSASTPEVKLSGWLRSDYRTQPLYTKFDLIEVKEHTKLSEDVKTLLRRLLANAIFDLGLLQAVAAKLGWGQVQSMIVAKAPKGLRLRRGDFGEIITNSLLEEFFGFTVPVQKLRYRIDSDQSLPGTDAVALKVRGDVVSEVCFIESKTRSTRATSAAVDGYQQLMSDFADEFSDIINFVLARMKESNHPLFDSFLNYLRDRDDTSNIESFRLGLVWETNEWSEATIENLEEARNSPVPKLVVILVRLLGLKSLVDELYDSIGVTEVLNGD